MEEVQRDFKFHIFRPQKNKYIKILKGTKWDFGSECYFFDTKEGGLKLYNNRKEAKNAFRRQKIANRKGLAPDLLSDDIIIINIKEDLAENFYNGYSCSHFNGRKYKRLYGYYTEKVKILYNLSYKKREKLNIDKKKLRISLSKLYGKNRFRDLRPVNIGIKKGKAVAIDFGKYSFCIKEDYSDEDYS